MSVLENIDFENIALIEKYLTDELEPGERKSFEKRLKKDSSLKEDYQIVCKAYNGSKHLVKENVFKKKLKNYHLEDSKIAEKAFVAKNIMHNSLVIALAVLTTIALCALFISFVVS